MSFKYKNLSKSALCMIVPMLVACGGKTRDNSELDSAVAALDSIQVAQNVYADVENVLMMDWFAADKVDSHENDILKQYQMTKASQMADSVHELNKKSRELQRRIDSLKNEKNAVMTPMTSSDSVVADYSRAIATKNAYMDAWEIVVRDYEETDEKTDYNSHVLSRYQLAKMFELSDSIGRYRSMARRINEKIK
ncbi:hypothetical protein HDR66_01700 [bacterium]|nr:hypothetical protein [bacterium]